MFGLGKLKIRQNREIEPQEIFLDTLAEKREDEVGITENKLEVPLSRGIIFGIFIFFLLCILFLLWQTAYLQIIKADEYSAMANQNKFAMGQVKAERGVIYDSTGKQLVFNKPSFDLTAKKNEITEDSVKEVSQILGISEDEIRSKISKDSKIAENLNHDLLVLLETKLNNLPGFQIQNNSTRYYQDGQIFSDLIGYVGKSANDYIGKDGLEKSYEDILKQNPGEVKQEKDVYGNLLSKQVISSPESGKGLVLWINSDLQKKAAEELQKVLDKTGAKKGVVIAMDPKTGGILALVSLPSYDNNLFTQGANQDDLNKVLNDPANPMLNRAIAGLYPTGSTIKPILATAALEEKLISPSKKINDTGSIEIQSKYDPNIVYVYHGITPHGWVDMRQAIAVSSNIYFYTIGGGYGEQQGLGPTRIKKYLDMFGWGKETNIDLPGETCGFIPTPNWKKTSKKAAWNDGDTYNMSIGQGDLLITPIQVAAAYSAIANGGILYKPQLVKQIIKDSPKTVLREITPAVANANFVSNSNLQIIREGMRMAVTGENAPQASSLLLNSLPVKAAAKTGTAETSRKDVYLNWANVFAPYDDPQIELTIMIENVKGLQSAALPAAQGILTYFFNGI